MDEKTSDIFIKAIGLNTDEWFIKDLELDESKKRIDFFLEHNANYEYHCPYCKSKITIKDYKDKVWRHLNIFEYECYIHARVPRVNCEKHGVVMIDVPWAPKFSRFTMKFAKMVFDLIKYVDSVKHLGELLHISDDTIWSLLTKKCSKLIRKLNFENVKKLSDDETGYKKGHNFITITVDPDEGKPIYVQAKNNYKTIGKLCVFLEKHKCNLKEISHVTSDMFGGFKKGYRIYLNRAKFVIDKFHVILNLNKALDKVRRSEYAKNKSIKHLRYSILKNKENLTTKDIKRIENLKKENSLTCKAYSLKESFSEFYKNQTKEEARKFYDIWASNLKKDNIPAFNTLIKTLSKNMKNILGWFETKITNACCEGVNNIFQMLKRCAKGFKKLINLRNILFIKCGTFNKYAPTQI